MSYEDSGFDSFLSRSIDDLQQVNLDSQGPYSTATAYDRSQLSGSMGDSFKMGGISMSARDSQMTLNDGALIVNDTSTDNTINASSGNIAYFDGTGSLVVQEGLLPDNTTGIRIIDKQGLGLAQFGRFPDGSTALKVAKPGIDVSVASNEDLIFNSDQDILKVALTGTIDINANAIAGVPIETSIVHGLGIAPIPFVFFNLGPGVFTQLPNSSAFAASGGQMAFNNWSYATTDDTNLYITFISGTTANWGTFTYKYYLLQETAS